MTQPLRPRRGILVVVGGMRRWLLNLSAQEELLVGATSFGPDPETVTELLTRQAALQSRAGDVIAGLDLIRLLAPVGRVTPVGSVATGLMVWCDIDIYVLCDAPSLGPPRVHAALNPLASHPSVKRLNFYKHSGPFRTPGLPDGLYYGIHYYEDGTSGGEPWKIDCWFLPLDAPRPEFALIDRVRRELTDETRLAILWIKDVWHRLPAYRDTVLSVDIYEAVLDYGVRSPDEFRAWLQERRND